MNLQQFRDVHDSEIFVYKNLRDFEKILFLEHQVNELITLIKRKNKYIKELDEQLQRAIEFNEENRQIIALKAEITNNHRIIRKYKQLWQEELNKNISK